MYNPFAPVQLSGAPTSPGAPSAGGNPPPSSSSDTTGVKSTPSRPPTTPSSSQFYTSPSTGGASSSLVPPGSSGTPSPYSAPPPSHSALTPPGGLSRPTSPQSSLVAPFSPKSSLQPQPLAPTPPTGGRSTSMHIPTPSANRIETDLIQGGHGGHGHSHGGGHGGQGGHGHSHGGNGGGGHGHSHGGGGCKHGHGHGGGGGGMAMGAGVMGEPLDVFAACRRGLLDNVKKFVEEELVSVDSTDKDGNTPLHWACFAKNRKIVDYLLSKRCDLSVANNTEQNTALHWAVMAGGKTLVGRLLNHGADPFRVDRRGYGCLHIAAQYGHVLLALFFLNKGISVDVFDNEGHTPLHWAAYTNNVALVELFLKNRADINKGDAKGMTPIHWAVTKGHLETVVCLLDHGAIINIKDKLDRLPLDHAKNKDLKQIATVLTAHSRTRPSLQTIWTLRVSMGLIIPIALFSLFVQLPLLFSLPSVFIIIAALMRLSGPAYPNLPGHSSNPFQVACSISQCLISLFIYYHYLDIHTEMSSTEAQTLLITGGSYLCLWFYLAFSDPGYVGGARMERKYRADYLLDMVGEGTAHTEQDIPEICPICMIGRPVRSAHCYKSGRCVALMDHHSPWINRAIGCKNLAGYFVSCCLAVVVHFLFVKFCISVIDEVRPDENGFLMFLFDSYEHAPMLFFALVLHFALLISALGKLYERYKCFSYGMTLSEIQDPASRPYLFAGGSVRAGRLNNPFDRQSVKKNALAMMCGSDGIDYMTRYHPYSKV